MPMNIVHDGAKSYSATVVDYHQLPKTISQISETVRQSPGSFWPAIFFLYMVGVAGCNHHLSSLHRRRPVETP